MSSDDAKREALPLLRAAVVDRAFIEVESLLLYECTICWATVQVSSKSLHLDWHDVVHRGLVELADLLKKE